MKVAARLVLVGTMAIGIAAAGCSGPEEPPKATLSASSFLGKPVSEAYSAVGYSPPTKIPQDLGVTSYNLAPVLTNEAPGGQAQPDWTVIASCYTDSPIPGGPTTPAPRLILGAVPANLATAQVQAQAQANAYNSRLTECRGRTPDTFTVTLPAVSGS